MSNTVLYSNLIVPNNGSASAPSIQFGASSQSSSGTGLFGDELSINWAIAGQELLSLGAEGLASTEDIFTPTHSMQLLAIDFNIGAASGKNISSGTAFLSPIMGNLIGASLSKTGNYLGGLIGADSVTGTKATHLQKGAVLGIISDGVTAADGAIVAILDGDSAQTNATAAFAVRGNNSTPGSGFAVGLDLYSPAHDGFSALSYSTAEIRLSNGVKITVSGDNIIFTNAAGNKSATITMS